MFLDKFEDGKRYRFNKEIFTSYMELMGWDVNSDWKDDIHLYEVTILSDKDGKVGDFKVSPEWCEEVIVVEALKTRDDIKDMCEQLLYLEELEKTLDGIDEYMTSGQMKTNFVKYIKSEIEGVIDELGLEE